MLGVLVWLDWGIIGVYLLFALAVGVAFSRRASKDTGEFFLSGRNLPWWLAGTSMVATSFAADTPLFVTGLVRKGGVSANWVWWAFAVGGMFSVFLLARLWRRAEVMTDVELTELRYSGRSAAALRAFKAAYMAGPINCLSMAWVLVAMVKLMTILFDVGPIQVLVGCVLVATVYCTLSGMWGVVWTDLVQFILAMGGAIAFCVVVVGSSGGLWQVVHGAREGAAPGLRDRLLDFIPLVPDGFHPWDLGFWEGPFVGFIVFITVLWWANKNADGGGVVVQRMASSRDERHSLLATLWFNVANYALRPWPWILVALASLAVPELRGVKDGEAVYPLMIEKFAPVGLMGVMVATFLAAFMSTIDTHMNLSASYVVNDVYRRFVRRGASERHYVLVSRIASVGFIVLSSVIALYARSILSLFMFMLAFSSGAGLVFILRWFWWRVNAWSEISAMIASGVIASALYLLNMHLGYLSYPTLSKALIILLTVVGSTVVWLAVTFLTRPVDEVKLVAFYCKVRPNGAWGRVAELAGVRPARGLGRQVVSWLAGTVMVLGATFAIGKFLLCSPGEGLAWSAAAVIGGAVVARELFGSRARRSA